MTDTFRWIDVDDRVWELSGFEDGAEVLEGVEGVGAPPTRAVRATVPGQPGTRLRSLMHDTRKVSLPVFFEAPTNRDLAFLLRDWQRRLDPARGTGRLRRESSAGDARELLCRCVDGFELIEDESHRYASPAQQLVDLTFEADWPYWQDLYDIAVTFTGTTPATFFPIFPLTLTEGVTFDAQLISNDGDVDAWPVWELVGPLNGITLANATTGRSFTWGGQLDAGETVTIDTRPAALTAAPKSIVDDSGTNRFGELRDYDIWPLAPGLQTVQVQPASVSADTRITLTWRQQYLGGV